jgi:hypothetical protein
MAYLNQKGHNTVLKSLKNSNIDVFELLEHIENIDDFLDRNVS